MKLFIAEKPSAAKAIADVLGNANRKDGYYDCGESIVSYAIGHLFEQQPPDAYLSNDIPKTKSGSKVWRLEDLPIVPDKWKYKTKPKTKKQLNTLGELIKDADEVVNAGDLDREGQAIIDHILDHFKCSVPVKRLCVSAQDEVSIQRGLASLKDNKDYQGWRNAALARQRADWLVGMNLSRSFTLEAQAKGDKSLLVVGRVQSPTLSLVVTRDRLIENFKSKDYFVVEADVLSDGGTFKAKWVPDKDSKVLDDENRIIDESAAKQAVNDLNQVKGTISKFETESKSTPQPLGLSLSDITLLASNKFGYSADKTLSTVQALYETHKLCSYPRTDCRYLPESQKNDAHSILQAISKTNPSLSHLTDAADLSINSRTFDDKKITAHHGVVPTMQEGDASKLPEAEARLYSLISLRYIAQFYPKHQFNQTTIEVESDPNHSENSPYTLRATGKAITINGWKDVYQGDNNESEKDNTPAQSLPNTIDNKTVNIAKGNVSSKKTKPPKHFSEGTLIKALEQIHRYVDNDEYRKLLSDDDGLGTPATRGNIISDLKRREYLTPKGKLLISTELGQRLVDTLPESVTSPVLTAKYERDLNSIQNDGGSLDDFVSNQVEFIKDQIANASSLIAANPAASNGSKHADSDKPTAPCPKCDRPLIRRKNTFKKTGFWWGCSGHPECTTTYPDKRGKPDCKVVKSESSVTEHSCPKCDSPLIQRKSAKGTIWYGCQGFPKCKERFFDKGGIPDIASTN